MFRKKVDIERAFAALAKGIDLSAEVADTGPAQATATALGLERSAEGKQSLTWERVDGSRRLSLHWRWYDQSQAFSMRPDRNILAAALENGGQREKYHENDFED